MAQSSEKLLRDAYAANLESNKANLENNYNQANANLDEQKIEAQKNTDTNLNRTAVEAQKARRNYAEVQNAYGLTSGAMAQANLAQHSAELQDMTALRAQQQENDAQIERERGQLQLQYNNAIREAQANNDYQLAQQLYQAAREREKALEDEKMRRQAVVWNQKFQDKHSKSTTPSYTRYTKKKTDGTTPEIAPDGTTPEIAPDGTNPTSLSDRRIAAMAKMIVTAAKNQSNSRATTVGIPLRKQFPGEYLK